MVMTKVAVLALLVSGCGEADPQVLFAGDASSQTDTAATDTAIETSAKPPCKRGMAYGNDSVADLTAISKGISWWYNWSPAPDNDAVAGAFAGLGLEFVPMVWGKDFKPADIEAKVVKTSTHLLGFNEPNFGSQANLTPAEAAALWPQVQQIADAKGLKLVSPALNYCGGSCNVTDPYVWLDQFFTACTGCRIDAIAVHWYACTQSALTGYLTKFETKFGKPLWLTEFSCLDASDRSEMVQQAYMKDALGVLEADPMVERYAWFTGRSTNTPTVNLLGADGALTMLGETYVGFPEGCR